jgi:hypothetical protein
VGPRRSTNRARGDGPVRPDTSISGGAARIAKEMGPFEQHGLNDLDPAKLLLK